MLIRPQIVFAETSNNKTDDCSRAGYKILEDLSLEGKKKILKWSLNELFGRPCTYTMLDKASMSLLVYIPINIPSLIALSAFFDEGIVAFSP